MVVTGAIATASGPHPGADQDVQRLGLGIRDTVYVHVRATAVFGIGLLLVGWPRPGAATRLPGVVRLAIVLLGVLLAQMVVGEVQYRNALPWGLVLVHVVARRGRSGRSRSGPRTRSGARRWRSSLRLPSGWRRWASLCSRADSPEAKASARDSGSSESRSAIRHSYAVPMASADLRIVERPTLRRPVLVTAFRGWNDGGPGGDARRRVSRAAVGREAVRGHRPGGVRRLPGHAAHRRPRRGAVAPHRVARERVLPRGASPGPTATP